MEEKNYRKSNKFLQKYRFDLKPKRKRQEILWNPEIRKDRS